MTAIDIVLPFYGPIDLLKGAVRSIIAQDDPEWRLTVVDDAYPDTSLATWFDYLDDDRIHYVRHENNVGLCDVFNECLRHVRGELFVMMGQDDMMLPNYVRTVRSAHRAHPKAAIIQPGVQVIDERGHESTAMVDRAKRLWYAPKVDGREVFEGESAAASVLRGNWTYFPSLCWRSEPVLDVGFHSKAQTVADLALILDLIERGESLLVDSRRCFQYRRHRSSASSVDAVSGERFTEERAFLRHAAERMAARGWHRATGIARRQVSSRLNALTVLPKAVRYRDPTSVRSLTKHVLGII